ILFPVFNATGVELYNQVVSIFVNDETGQEIVFSVDQPIGICSWFFYVLPS
ncbi:MAG: hypothetical protein H6Q53_1317, partial [Deltaproteobacteria bacterium]|nr:hypothetical protein [Deltaproteobacteria bacterium]